MHVEPVTLTPIGKVVGGRTEPDDDSWSSVEAGTHLDDQRFGPTWSLTSRTSTSSSFRSTKRR